MTNLDKEEDNSLRAALWGVAYNFVRLSIVLAVAWRAFTIRTHAINDYGRVIHEFDPWFNFRATQYLADNGWTAFFTWFDDRSWYPLGRPVGTTIYPGMQFTAVAIWKALNASGFEMSLNDVCVFIPAWFGVVATLLLGLLCKECSKSTNAGIAAAAIMSIIPAHTMRSVGGGYDNESIAVSAMIATFYFWCRAVRDESSWKFGFIAGLAYGYMVAVWGGYIFVINMVGLHALALLFFGKFSPSLHKAYSIFYVVGTSLAVCVPPVGWAPLKSLEQLMPFGVFVLMQLVSYCEHCRRQEKHDDAAKIYKRVFTYAATAGVIVLALLYPTGYFGPLSSRVRSLFVSHTRTGNPLVDSVAEHQPATANAYWQYMLYCCWIAPIGMIVGLYKDRSCAKIFIVLYGCTAYFFANKMMRLIILAGPVASSLSGIAIGAMVDDAVDAASGYFSSDDAEPSSENGKQENGEKEGKPSSAKKAKKKLRANKSSASNGPADSLGDFVRNYSTRRGQGMRLILWTSIVVIMLPYAKEFSSRSEEMAVAMSNPQLMMKAQARDGSIVMIDDYREAYWWLRDNTPEDSRVMAWWDYGYQISGIANRTTIADGNTWNHEHIATLGRCLTSPVREAHRMIRHMADYVLVWAGGGADDLAKSPHMARIGNSVYKDICPGDPICAQFGFDPTTGEPTPMMEKSLLYHLINDKARVKIDPNRFRQAYQSKYGKVIIYEVLSVDQKSKAWVADPANKLCDAPGSWYCPGQYPPALNKFFDRYRVQKKDFAQLENFNVAAGDDDYQKAYHSRMAGGAAPAAAASAAAPDASAAAAAAAATDAPRWEDTTLSEGMKKSIESNDIDALSALVAASPAAASLRSADGGGPLFWAHASKNLEMQKLLVAAGAREDAVDARGKKPSDY